MFIPFLSLSFLPWPSSVKPNQFMLALSSSFLPSFLRGWLVVSQFLKAPQRLALQMNSLSMLPSICQKAAVWVTSVRWFTQNLKQNSSRSYRGAITSSHSMNTGTVYSRSATSGPWAKTGPPSDFFGAPLVLGQKRLKSPGIQKKKQFNVR